jgi:hypothetical protein
MLFVRHFAGNRRCRRAEQAYRCVKLHRTCLHCDWRLHDNSCDTKRCDSNDFTVLLKIDSACFWSDAWLLHYGNISGATISCENVTSNQLLHDPRERTSWRHDRRRTRSLQGKVSWFESCTKWVTCHVTERRCEPNKMGGSFNNWFKRHKQKYAMCTFIKWATKIKLHKLFLGQPTWGFV